MKQRLINTTKNIILVLLTLLMAVLTVLIWVRSLSWEDIPVESGFGQFYIRMAYGSASVFGLRTEDVPAAYPTEIAVRVSGQMFGAQNDTTGVDALLEQFQDPISAALNDSVRDLKPGGEADYVQALEQDCIFIRYEHALPLELIFLWLGDGGTQIPAVSARSLLVSSSGQIWIRDEGNALFVYDSAVDSKGWSDRLGESIFGTCRFAGNESSSDGVAPDTLIFDDHRQAYPVVEMAEPAYLDSNGVDNLQVVLEAFAYNTSVGNYMDDMKRVFVNNNSTLRIGTKGDILFHATSMKGGMEAYQEGEITENDELPLRVNTAKAILEQIQRSYSTEADFFLRSVSRDAVSGRVQLHFQYQCNGVPVTGEVGRFAVIEFVENALVSAEIHARTFASTEQTRFLIPSEQLMAMADSSDESILLGYFFQEGLLYPHRYFERVV